jgi:1,4-alpha-glucan branching enzyme
VIYQLHVGTFFTPNLPGKAGTFLDVARKIPHFADLGVTAIQLMPIQEFQTQFSLGYNGTDYFSPEMDFAVRRRRPWALRHGGKQAARCHGTITLSGGRLAR